MRPGLALAALLALTACSGGAWEIIGDIVLGPPPNPCATRTVLVDPAADLESTMLAITELRRACLVSRQGARPPGA